MFFLLAILLSILFSAFFSATETAFVALTDVQIKILDSKHPRRGKIVQFLKDREETFISAMLIGNNAANVAFSVFVTQYTIKTFGETAVVFSSIIIVLLMLLFGEIPPKQLAIRYGYQFILVFSFPLLVIFILLSPIAHLFSFFSMFISIFLKKKKTNVIETISQEHLIHLFYQMRFTRNIPKNKTRRIMRALTLSETPIENIMTRRPDVFSLPGDTTIQEALSILEKTFHTHIPIYQGDDIEHIVGVVQAKDLIRKKQQKQEKNQLDSIMKTVSIVQETKNIEDCLNTFKEENTRFVVVIDEFGGLAGIITMTDIAFHVLETTTSKNQKDIEKIFKDKKYIVPHKTQRNTFWVDASAELSDIEEIAHTTIHPRPESHTIGGYLAEHTGGSYISDNKKTKGISTPVTEKTIHHETLGVFTILEEKNGRIISLIWKNDKN